MTAFLLLQEQFNCSFKDVCSLRKGTTTTGQTANSMLLQVLSGNFCLTPYLSGMNNNNQLGTYYHFSFKNSYKLKLEFYVNLVIESKAGDPSEINS